MSTAALLTVAKTRKHPKCPLTGEGWSRCGTHAMRYYSAIRKDKRLPFATMWTDIESIVLTEVSQTEKVKNHDFTHIWDIQLKATRKTNKNSQAETTVWSLPERRRLGEAKGKGVKCMAAEEDVTLGGGHRVQHTDHVSQRRALETYTILLTDVTPVDLVLKQ